MASVNNGIHRITAVLSKARAMPDDRAEREAHVEGGVHVRLRGHPLVLGHHVEDVGVATGAAGVLDDLEADDHRDVALEAVDEGPRGEQERGEEGTGRPHPLRPDPVGQPPGRVGHQEGHDARDGEAETDLGGPQPHHLGEEDGGAGQEGALGGREQQGLGREPTRQRRRRDQPP
jgi:hypothetical protein